MDNRGMEVTYIVVPVGDRFLCWVNYRSGLLMFHMVHECPKLHYVPMPVEPPYGYGYYDEGYVPDMECTRTLCGVVTRTLCGVGSATLRYTIIDPRCCCGGPGRGTCVHCRSAFTVTTWNLNLSMAEPMTWVKDTILDCNDIWMHPAYERLPRVHPQEPIMSPDNPDIVCV
ncbi:hypothetical protein QOZ80_9BG0694610 [Eleusine coracana subsp. coracana]|nr:hypothetical protein QOZ80_9BG0694610 [Eleusine coracana subsp. coracana]